MSRMFGKACCGSNDGATMSPAWTQAPATSALLPSTPGTARRVSGTAPHGPHLELEPLPADLQLLSPGKMSRSWAPNDENTTPVVGARPAAPLVLAHGEWGPKAWQSPTRRSNRVEAADAGVSHLCLDSPELCENAGRVAASLERVPSVTPPLVTALSSIDPNTWLSRQGSKARQDSLPVTPDVFAPGGMSTPYTVDVLLTPSAHEVTAAPTAAAALVCTPCHKPSALLTPLTALLPRGARLLLRASRPTPAKEDVREVEEPQQMEMPVRLFGTMLLLLLSVAAASYSVLVSKSVPTGSSDMRASSLATAMVPFVSPAPSPSGDWYLLTHTLYMMLPACAPPSASHDAGSVVLYGVCHDATSVLPLARIPNLNTAAIPALHVDVPALKASARNALAAVAHAVGSVKPAIPKTTLPLADMAGIGALALVGIYCGARLMRWRASMHADTANAAYEAATPYEADVCPSSSWVLSGSEADNDVASLPRNLSDEIVVTPAHPRTLSFSRADAASDELQDDGLPSVMMAVRRGRQPRRGAAAKAAAQPAALEQAQPRMTRQRATRR